MNFDFTSDIAQAMGPSQMKQVGLKAVLVAGDFDGSGVINNNDYNRWISNNSAVGNYLNWDADINGVINNLDYNLWYANRSKVGIPQIQF